MLSRCCICRSVGLLFVVLLYAATSNAGRFHHNRFYGFDLFSVQGPHLFSPQYLAVNSGFGGHFGHGYYGGFRFGGFGRGYGGGYGGFGGYGGYRNNSNLGQIGFTGNYGRGGYDPGSPLQRFTGLGKQFNPVYNSIPVRNDHHYGFIRRHHDGHYYVHFKHGGHNRIFIDSFGNISGHHFSHAFRDLYSIWYRKYFRGERVPSHWAAFLKIHWSRFKSNHWSWFRGKFHYPDFAFQPYGQLPAVLAERFHKNYGRSYRHSSGFGYSSSRHFNNLPSL